MIQKRLQAGKILLHVWRELKKNHSQTILEGAGGFNQIRHVGFCILESLEMCNPLRCLYRETKSLGHLLFPVFKYAFLRQTIESVIDLDSRKAGRIIREHLLRRQVLWIEISLPLLIT